MQSNRRQAAKQEKAARLRRRIQPGGRLPKDALTDASLGWNKPSMMTKL